MRPAPTNKREMFERLSAGEFGNTAVTVKSTIEALKYHEIKWWTVRGLELGTSYFRGPIPRDCLFHTEWDAQRKIGRNNYVISEAIGTHNVLFQGHLAFDPAPVLEWTDRKVYLKHLFAGEYHHAEGLAVRSLLRRWSDSADWLEHLAYESGGVVEFSVFSKRCGTLHSNTIIWEVRGY